MEDRVMARSGKTGRKGIGEIVGEKAHVDASSDRLAGYRLRLSRKEGQKLAQMLGKQDNECEFVLTATSERFERLRVLSSPLPQYERRAARRHVRGDAVRVTGSQRSCNI